MDAIEGPRQATTDYRPGYRPDIDGLRAISILLVVGFHAGLSALSGGFVGVDVFFVLSGYLITGILVTELAKTDRVSLLRFYARRARRLLPLAALVIATTVVVTFWLVAPLGRAEMVDDARAASMYYANWRFAGETATYSEAEVSESFFLHYWSLSIEEQFYLLWPVLILTAGLISRRLGKRDVAPTLLAAIGGVFAISFVASVFSIGQGANSYYFTHTRVWELAVGAGLAILLPRLRMTRLPSLTAGIIGLVMILVAAMTFDSETAFPGYAALLPVLGCALLVASGAASPTWLSRWLSVRPMTYIGRISYAWYLWHWPAIGIAVLLAAKTTTSASPALLMSAALVVSFGLAAASHVLVERPVRSAPNLVARPRLSLGLGAVLTVGPLVLGIALLTGEAAESESMVDSSQIAMSPEEAAADLAELGPAQCHARFRDTAAPTECVYGLPEGRITVALVGDSHAQHWLPALDQAGRDHGWRVLAWSKSSCTVIDVPLRNDRLERDYHECSSWRQSVLRNLEADGGVEVVLIGDSYNYSELVTDERGQIFADAESLLQAWRSGAARTFAQYGEVTDTLVMLRDTPWASRNVPNCLSEDVTTPERCAFPLEGSAWLDKAYVTEELAVGGSQVGTLDMTIEICESDPCIVVTDDGIVKYRDGQHLTRTFSRSLAGSLADAIQPFLGD